MEQISILLGHIWRGFNQLLLIVGGLGTFIFGMKVLSDGLQNAAGSGMQNILDKMTGTPLLSIGTGLGITCLLQSSSATTVMVVSVVNAGLLSLSGAVGVIMGANIGTTLTAWIVSALGFQISVKAFALPIIAVGLPLLLSDKFKNKGAAEAMVGFGILFIGLGFLKEYLATAEMKEFISSFVTLINLDNYLLRFPVFVLLGTILTVLVQSSSAAMTITLTLMSIGALEFEQGAMIVLGENIGTTITAYLASLGANINAKRASRVHIIFNVFGVLWMFAAFYGFLWLVRFIIPDGAVLFGNPNYNLFQLSLFHSLFNITNTLLLAGFIPQLEKLATRMVPVRDAQVASSLKLLRSGYQEVTDAHIYEAEQYLKRLVQHVRNMMTRFESFVGKDGKDGEGKALHEKQTMEKADVDILEEELSSFLIDLSSSDLSIAHRRQLSQMLQVISEFERIAGEYVKIASLMKKLDKRDLLLDASMKDSLGDFTALVHRSLEWSSDHLPGVNPESEKPDTDELLSAIEKQRKKMVKGTRNRLQEGANVRLELIFFDMINGLASIGSQSMELTSAGIEEHAE